MKKLNFILLLFASIALIGCGGNSVVPIPEPDPEPDPDPDLDPIALLSPDE